MISIDALLSNQFLINAFIAGILTALACGITGTFVSVKKMSYLGGGIAHAVMGGVGIAYYLNINPMWGAIAFAIFSALIMGFVRFNYKQNEDTIISALWSVGMALGIILAYITPGYNVDLLSFLFGNILLVSKTDLLLLLLLNIIISVIVIIYYRQFIYISFDEEYSMLRGINVKIVYYLLLVLIALAIVVLVKTVGVILVIALLTLPVAIIRMFTNRISRIIFYSIILTGLLNFTGLAISFKVNLPSGATIILLTGMIYILSFTFKRYSKNNG